MLEHKSVIQSYSGGGLGSCLTLPDLNYHFRSTNEEFDRGATRLMPGPALNLCISMMPC